jgi:hypothetical protein
MIKKMIKKTRIEIKNQTKLNEILNEKIKKNNAKDKK